MTNTLDFLGKDKYSDNPFISGYQDFLKEKIFKETFFEKFSFHLNVRIIEVFWVLGNVGYMLMMF